LDGTVALNALISCGDMVFTSGSLTVVWTTPEGVEAGVVACAASSRMKVVSTVG
jgi:hypothetical protein